MAENSHLLTVAEVAAKLGLTDHQVYRRIKRGDIKARLGGRNNLSHVVDAGDLQAYIDAGQPLSAPRRDGSMLGVPEVAKMTGFTDETVRKMCYDGRLRYVRGAKKGGHLRIFRSSVEAYLRSESQH